jgi:hypothetical protein
MQLSSEVPRYSFWERKAIMRTLGKITATLGVLGAIALAGVVPASADWYGHHHRYYNYYGGYHGGGDLNGCPRGWTVQGGVCKPYQHGPWDIYGGTHQDWGYR